MIVITLGNEKGGVGKTTFSIEAACGFASRGYSTLLIDTDAQANATTGLGLRKEPGLYNLLIREAGWKDSVRAIRQEVWQRDGEGGRLVILPSNIESRGIPLFINDPYLLKERLEQVAHVFDVVVIDTPPTPSLLHAVILNASDYFIAVTEAETHSLAGLKATVEHIESAIDKKGLGVRIAGVQTNHFRSNTLEHSEYFADLQAWSDYPVWPAVSERIVWAEAAHACLPLYQYAPKDKAFEEANAFVDRLESIIKEVAYE